MFLHANTGMTRIDFDKEGKYSLIYLNLAEHLEEELAAMFIKQNTFNIEAEYSDSNKIDNDLIPFNSLPPVQKNQEQENEKKETSTQIEFETISEVSQTNEILNKTSETQTNENEIHDDVSPQIQDNNCQTDDISQIE